VGLFDHHKAMQDLPVEQRRKAYWKTLSSSKFHLWLLGLYLAWAVALIISLLLDRDTFEFSIATLIVVITMFPFQLIKPKRQLAEVLVKMNIRPSHCPCCQHDLQATADDTCPQCSTRLAPQTDTDDSPAR
jgi:multisubunit Na+/H+ antiporter MnhE subunit